MSSDEVIISAGDAAAHSTPGSGDKPVDAAQLVQEPATAASAPSAKHVAPADAVEDPGNDNSTPVISVPIPEPAGESAAASAVEDPADIDAMLREIGWESRGPSVRTSAHAQPKPSVRTTGR